jgi:hypothetical protein
LKKDKKVAKKESARRKGQYERAHRTEVPEADLDADEQEETVFIDNLPDTEHGIRAMLREVRCHIYKLEK